MKTLLSLFPVSILLLAFLSISLNIYAQSAGNALEFDGSDDYVNIGNGASLDVGNTLTIEAWVYPTDLSSRKGIFSTRLVNDPGSFQLEVGIGEGGTGRVAVTGIGTWIAQTGDDAIRANTWSHIVYTRSGTGSGTHKIYVNGVEQTLISDEDYTFVNNTSDKVLATGTNGGQLFAGQLDEVRIWNTVRTQTEIQNNMFTVLSGTESGLVAYYQFNSSSGSTLYDLTSNNNDGTLINMDNSDWITSLAAVDVDFGDAPAPSLVLFSEYGAYHEAVGPTLGALRDTDNDGTHSSDATGDGADEDGVSNWQYLIPGKQDASVTVNVKTDLLNWIFGLTGIGTAPGGRGTNRW